MLKNVSVTSEARAAIELCILFREERSQFAVRRADIDEVIGQQIQKVLLLIEK